MNCSKSKSPFKNTDNAFDPFFTEYVKVTLKSGECQTLKVALFDDIEGDPLGEEGSMDTTRKDIQINARQEDWHFVEKMARGDLVEIPTNSKGAKYRVQTVKNDFALGIIIKAREI